ncbi:lipase 3 [Leptinotarsa decemlineata]|uniref:lipase 3 n=1 Tax=Leptinotarsa decemlineata TaxID=7539 RepID=UPI003D30BBDE
MYFYMMMLMVLAVPDNSVGQNPNNVCPTWRDYFTMKSNPKCWYDFAADNKVPEIIKKSGYPFMEYKVKTNDGYFLTVFRIPGVASSKPPIFLMHGVQGTSAIYLGLGKNSLAFLLYEAGYDVWLGNYRGTEYSEEHETMNTTQREYWDYSVQDIALKDIPTMLQLVKYHSGHRGKIIYIGHSLGTTTGIMYAAEYGQSAADTLGLLVLLTPAYKLPNMRSPYRIFFPLLNPALEITNTLNLVQSVSSSNLRNLTRPLCSTSPPLMLLCLNVMNLFLGPFTQIAPETVPVYFNQIPAGTSLKTLTYLNEATMNRFTKYDYGPGKNRYLYGSDTPPEFDLKNIRVPIYIMFARNDWSTTRKDSIAFYNTIPEEMRYGMHEIRNLNFNHYDFLFGRDSKKLVTDKLLQVLDQFSASSPSYNISTSVTPS